MKTINVRINDIDMLRLRTIAKGFVKPRDVISQVIDFYEDHHGIHDVDGDVICTSCSEKLMVSEDDAIECVKHDNPSEYRECTCTHCKTKNVFFNTHK